MITAESANKKTFESVKAKEKLEEKYYLEVLQKIEDKIINTIKDGHFKICLKTDFMYPFKNRVMNELTQNGYQVILNPSNGFLSEYMSISWGNL